MKMLKELYEKSFELLKKFRENKKSLWKIIDRLFYVIAIHHSP
jgi:hypothetical protein